MMSMALGAGGIHSRGGQGLQTGLSLSSSPPQSGVSPSPTLLRLPANKRAKTNNLKRGPGDFDSTGRKVATAAGSSLAALSQGCSSSATSIVSSHAVSAPIPIRAQHRPDLLNSLPPPVIRTSTSPRVGASQVGTPPDFSPTIHLPGRVRSPAQSRANSVERTQPPKLPWNYQGPASAAASSTSSRRSSKSQSVQQVRQHEVVSEEQPGVDPEQSQFMTYIDSAFVRGSAFWNEVQEMIKEPLFLSEILRSYAAFRGYLESEKITAQIFDLLREDQDDNHLRNFITMMPMVDLHSHISGAMSSSFCIEKAIEHDFFWDSKYKKFCSVGDIRPKHFSQSSTGLSELRMGGRFYKAEKIMRDHVLAEKVRAALCMQGRVDGQKSDHYFFHHACPSNESVTGKLPLHEMLVEDLKNAGVENIRLKEIMVDLRIINLEFPEGYAELFLSSNHESPVVRRSPAPSVSGSPALSALASPEAASASAAAASSTSGSPSTTPEPLTSPGSMTPPEPMTLPEAMTLSSKWRRALVLLQESGWLERYVTHWTAHLKSCNELVSRALKQEVENDVFQTMPEWFYLVEIMRDTQDDKLFFATIAAAMALELKGRRNSDDFVKVVGLNLVGPEHAIPSMGSFPKQIEMMQFLSEVYEQPRISLHAGEFGESSPVRSHGKVVNMLSSLKVARRIGHGTAIIGANQVKEKMFEDDIAVEICLTSNKQILGIDLAQNPIKFYLDQRISVVLCTDNDGILGTNLTKEFVEASKTYKWLFYSVFKNLIRNALHYSFIGRDSQSIFAKNKTDGLLYLHPAFWGMHEHMSEPNWSPSGGKALEMYNASLRVRLQVEMELKIAKIEAEMNRTHREKWVRSQTAANQALVDKMHPFLRLQQQLSQMNQ